MMSGKQRNAPEMTQGIERNPIYQQVNDQLRGLLATDFQLGDRFLTEREISGRYQVSRATANKALASLVSEGLLEFKRGVGTFVRRNAIAYDVRSLVSFTEKAKAARKRPTTELLTFGEIAAGNVDPTVAMQLGVTLDTELWEIERVRFADDTPVICEHRFVIKSHCPRLTRRQASGSLYRAWSQTHGLAISGAEEVIRAVLLKTNEARHLQVASRSPAFEVTAVGFVGDQEPLWWERTLYRGDLYEFYSQLGPIQSATPARGKLRDP
jgi:GntR family transcriptional regulator